MSHGRTIDNQTWFLHQTFLVRWVARQAAELKINICERTDESASRVNGHQVQWSRLRSIDSQVVRQHCWVCRPSQARMNGHSQLFSRWNHRPRVRDQGELSCWTTWSVVWRRRIGYARSCIKWITASLLFNPDTLRELLNCVPTLRPHIIICLRGRSSRGNTSPIEKN